MGLSLRGAFIISAIIHASVFASFYNQHILSQEFNKKNSVVVDYVILKQIAAAMTANKEVAVNKPEPLQAPLQKDVAVRSQPVPQIKADNRNNANFNKLKERTRLHIRGAMAGLSEGSAKKGAQLRQSKDYVNYYQLIRDRIRSRLKDNYQYYNREGEVQLSFVLNQNGSLLSYAIDRSKSTQDEVLLHITATSIKAISPFPALPKSLTMPKMSFNIIISFKK